MAINRLLERPPVDQERVDHFVARHGSPIVEGDRATFLWQGEADEVLVRHRVMGLPDPLTMRRVPETNLWYVSIDMPPESRVEYQYEIVRGTYRESFVNDPLNPKLAHSPFGASSVCAATGYEVPEWTLPDPEARAGTLAEDGFQSKALRRHASFRVYVPAQFTRLLRYPLIIVHDGYDYLNFASMQTVLDNLIHRGEMSEAIVVFTPPGERRLVEYANYAPHARFVARELVAHLDEHYPLVDKREGRTLMGSSFGGVASLSTARRYPSLFGSLILQSASLVFTDIGMHHGGGAAFDPVVKFVNRYRAHPKPVANRIYMSCGMYEPLITPNRSMVSTLRETGMDVRYREARDGHNWENWRDRLRDGLSWLFPGPQKYVYE